MRIEDTTTIADIAAAEPASVRVFQRHGIDFCCGGRKPLAGVCRDRGLDFGEIVAAIEAATAPTPGGQRNWAIEPLTSLIGHIIATYHQPLRDELPRLDAMARKVAQVHGAREPRLTQVAALVAELARELTAHMRKEELVLFPAIDALAAGTLSRGMPLSAPIAVMQHEHDDANTLLTELRRLTDGHVAPESACATWRALYQGLSDLESEMHVHVHLENNILFPRALQLTAVS